MALAKEIGYIKDDENPKLAELRQIVSKHPAFEIGTKLEQLASKYGVDIIWCPKYHCELNPIEGVWCYMKYYVRKHNDQNFDKLFNLIETSMNEYDESGIHVKLWNRFWEAIEMYNNGNEEDLKLSL